MAFRRKSFSSNFSHCSFEDYEKQIPKTNPSDDVNWMKNLPDEKMKLFQVSQIFEVCQKLYGDDRDTSIKLFKFIPNHYASRAKFSQRDFRMMVLQSFVDGNFYDFIDSLDHFNEPFWEELPIQIFLHLHKRMDLWDRLNKISNEIILSEDERELLKFLVDIYLIQGYRFDDYTINILPDKKIEITYCNTLSIQEKYCEGELCLIFYIPDGLEYAVSEKTTTIIEYKNLRKISCVVTNSLNG